MKKVITVFIALIILTSIVTAHPGKTDSKGGHYDRKNGGYHYHHGYPAHEHKNGECPYDFETQTQKSEKEPSKTESKAVTQSNSYKSKQETKKRTPLWKKIIEIIIIVIAFSIVFIFYIGPAICAILNFLAMILYELFKKIITSLKKRFFNKK